jgi:hypothetical protein
LIILLGCCSLASAHDVYTVEHLEGWVFQQDGKAAAARQRLDSHLAIQLDDVQRACKLSDAQMAKLMLAGRGDIKHFFDRYEVFRKEFKPIDEEGPDFQDVWRKFWDKVTPLQKQLQTGLFGPESLFAKSLATTLTADQKADYLAHQKERRRYQHENAINKVVQEIDQLARLTKAQRRQLRELLTKETIPARRQSLYESHYLWWQLTQLAKPWQQDLLDAVQRKAIQKRLDQALVTAELMRQEKLWPGDEPDANGQALPAAKPAPSK